MASTIRIHGETSTKMDQPSSSRKKAVLGRVVWILLEPSPEEVAELFHHFPEVMELPREEVRVESEGWAVETLVAQSLG